MTFPRSVTEASPGEVALTLFWLGGPHICAFNAPAEHREGCHGLATRAGCASGWLRPVSDGYVVFSCGAGRPGSLCVRWAARAHDSERAGQRGLRVRMRALYRASPKSGSRLGPVQALAGAGGTGAARRTAGHAVSDPPASSKLLIFEKWGIGGHRRAGGSTFTPSQPWAVP